MMFPDDVTQSAREVLECCRARRWRIATVESCTGGLIAGALTEIPGSSDVVDGGLVTYANSAKMGLVGVEHEILERYGAVSVETAEAMARGGLHRFPGVTLVVSVTGVAGPGGGSPAKPVGLVCFGVGFRDPSSGAENVTSERHVFPTTGASTARVGVGADPVRGAVRLATVRHALALLLSRTKA